MRSSRSYLAVVNACKMDQHHGVSRRVGPFVVVPIRLFPILVSGWRVVRDTSDEWPMAARYPKPES